MSNAYFEINENFQPPFIGWGGYFDNFPCREVIFHLRDASIEVEVVRGLVYVRETKSVSNLTSIPPFNKKGFVKRSVLVAHVGRSNVNPYFVMLDDDNLSMEDKMRVLCQRIEPRFEHQGRIYGKLAAGCWWRDIP